MYMIEMHNRTSANSQIVFEKGDATKTYEEFSNYKLITNHAGDVDVRSCPWCAIQRRAALMRERRAAANVVSGSSNSGVSGRQP